MNVTECINAYINDLGKTIKLFKYNKASHPLSIANTKNRWWVNVEIDSPHGTFDIETNDESLENALSTALSKLRREAYIKRLVAE